MRWTIRVVPLLLLAASLVTLFWPRGGETVPLYAARTGQLCQTCHFDPNGGSQRNEFGFAFARNRHSLEPEDSTSAFADLSITNRVGETMPVYFGINHRLMLLTNTSVEPDSLDRFGFFNMENGLHVAFQPHSKLTLVYTRDREISREAFGMIGGLPLNGYLKAGQFRNPFGLRMDDHTVATRSGYNEFFYQASQVQPWGPLVRQRYLPFEARSTDTGLELGAERSGFYGRLAFTNGDANLFFGNTFAETKALKFGYNRPGYQSALSFYDQYAKNPLFGQKRATRWAYAALTSYGPFALLGEIGAGTDEDLGGSKRNVLAGFAELDYAPTRSTNFRVRFDRMMLDRSTDPLIRDLNSHNRLSLEGEYVPVPFAELRWALQLIDHQASTDPLGGDIEDERQAFLQMHFSY